MSVKGILRLLRGALGTAALWGATWFAAGFALLSAAHLGGFLPMADPWTLILYISASNGVAGFLTGGAFSVYLRLAYWERSLLSIRLGRFALGGAVVAGIFSTAFTLLTRLSLGVGFVMADVVSGIGAAALGAATAGTSLWIAQRASRELTGEASIELEAEQRDVLALLGDETA